LGKWFFNQIQFGRHGNERQLSELFKKLKEKGKEYEVLHKDVN